MGSGFIVRAAGIVILWIFWTSGEMMDEDTVYARKEEPATVSAQLVATFISQAAIVLSGRLHSR